MVALASFGSLQRLTLPLSSISMCMSAWPERKELLARALSGLGSLTSLNLSCGDSFDHSVSFLASIKTVQPFRKLKELHLEGVGDDFESLSGCPELVTLSLQGSDSFGERDDKYTGGHLRLDFADRLRKLEKLEKLRLTNFASDSFTSLVPALSSFTHLKELDLSGLDVSSLQDFESAAAAIRNMGQLRVLGVFGILYNAAPRVKEVLKKPHSVLGALNIRGKPYLRELILSNAFAMQLEDVQGWVRILNPRISVSLKW